MKIKFSWKVWLWIVVFLLAIIAIINPNILQKGILITSVEPNSSAFEQGLRQGQIITQIDGKPVSNLQDFAEIISSKINSGEKVKSTITTTNSEYVIYSNKIEITVGEIPRTNLKTGLDISGGARALVTAKNHSLTKQEVNDLVNVVSNRLNVYGVSDLTIRAVSDLAGNNFMLVEIAGTTPKDLENLISQQGKFEAKLGKETVFVGGDKDIASVSRSGQESGIYACDQSSDGYLCEFRFVVYLSESAAEKHALVTQNLSVNSTAQGNYLSEKLDLFLDDVLVDSLLVSEDLKGRVTTQIQISGFGNGPTKIDAYNSAVKSMNNLQTILITGSLPFQLEVLKLDTISPTLGSNFTRSILIAGVISLLLVSLIVFIRYKGIKSSLLPIIICTSEIIITLGVAAVLKWDLDLPSIAGILAAIGTGVDDQIVILDEAKGKDPTISIKQKIKRAFAIVLGAYFTVVASLIPLWWAGVGMLRGFAFTTLIGITIGVLITRPAFADLIKSEDK